MGGDLDEILKRRYLRVLVVPERLGLFFEDGQLRGATHEIMTEFQRLLNKKYNKQHLPIEFVYIPARRDQILDMLADGRGDIGAGRLPVTDSGKAKVDFSIPVLDDARAVLVTGPTAPAISKVEDLAGKEIFLTRGAPLEMLGGVNAKLKAQGKPAIRVQQLDENLNVDDALEMVNAGLIPMTAAESHIATVWSKVFQDLRVHSDIVVGEGAIAWAMRKGTPKLTAEVNDFLKDHKVGTAYGSTVARRYYQDAKWALRATAPDQVAKFRTIIDLFKKHGAEYGFPYLLVAAQAYQESRLNQQLRSPVGALGVMQIKPSTAAGHPINIKDVSKVENNIRAGVKYLRYIQDEYFKDEPMDQINKGLFTIASYNAGPNKIARLRSEAKDSGFDENKWFNNVEIIAGKRIGRETTDYVANIYKYYLAYKMIVEAEESRTQKKGAPAKNAGS